MREFLFALLGAAAVGSVCADQSIVPSDLGEDLTVPGGRATSILIADGSWHKGSGKTSGPSRAFDNDATTNDDNHRVMVSTQPYDVIYTFEEPTRVNAYKVYIPNASQTRAPKVWTFEGSSDYNPDTKEGSWTVLDTQLSETAWPGTGFRYYQFYNTTAYKSYRFYITENNGDTTDSFFSELELFYYAPNVPANHVPMYRTVTGYHAASFESGKVKTIVGEVSPATVKTANDCYIAYGDVDYGEVKDDWPHVAYVGEVAFDDEVTPEVTIPADFGKGEYKMFRFFMVPKVAWDRAVDYIQSAEITKEGDTPRTWIDTGYVPEAGTLRLIMDYRPLTNIPQQRFFGTEASSTKNFSVEQYANSNRRYAYIYANGTTTGDVWKDSSVGVSAQRMVHFDLNGVAKTVEWSREATKSMTVSSAANTSAERSLYLFVNHNSKGVTANPGYFRLYNCEIYEAGVPQRLYIPCVKDGAAALYDAVNDDFAINANTAEDAPDFVVSERTITPAALPGTLLIATTAASTLTLDPLIGGLRANVKLDGVAEGDASIYISYGVDMDHLGTETLVSSTAHDGETVTYDITGLADLTAYCVRARIVDAAGEESVLVKIAETYGPSQFPETIDVQSRADFPLGNERISYTLEVLGSGDTVAELWWGTSADVEQMEFSGLALTNEQFGAFNVEYGVPGDVAYFQVRFLETIPDITGEWTDSTAVVPVLVFDNSTYTWKSSVASGDWMDPDNWDCNNEGTIGHPCMVTNQLANAGTWGGATAKFASAVVVSMTNSVGIYQLQLASGAAVRIAGAVEPAPNLTYYTISGLNTAGASLTFDHLQVVSKPSGDTSVSGADFVFALANGAQLNPAGKYKFTGARQRFLVSGGSVFDSTASSVEFSSPGGEMVLDNGTLNSKWNMNLYPGTGDAARLVMRGAQPLIKCGTGILNGANPPSVVLEPSVATDPAVALFAHGWVGGSRSNNGMFFGRDGKTFVSVPVMIGVDAAALKAWKKAAKSTGMTNDYLVADWSSGGILTNMVNFSVLDGNDRFYYGSETYTPTDADAGDYKGQAFPTKLYLHLEQDRVPDGLRIILR